MEREELFPMVHTPFLTTCHYPGTSTMQFSPGIYHSSKVPLSQVPSPQGDQGLGTRLHNKLQNLTKGHFGLHQLHWSLSLSTELQSFGDWIVQKQGSRKDPATTCKHTTTPMAWTILDVSASVLTVPP